MISLLVPSRQRPEGVKRLLRSIETTVWGEWEMIVRLDDDDETVDNYPTHPSITYLSQPRSLMANNWNDAAEHSHGDILWHGSDDMVMRTIGWDQIVRDAFPPDHIALVHGHDLSPNGDWLATAGFIHRVWYDTLGFITAPYFSSDYCDSWLVDVSQALERRIYVPIITEHHHPAHGKAEWDLSHLERLERHKADDVDALYRSPEMVQKRTDDAAKLRELMR